jgi:hypothetical protein
MTTSLKGARELSLRGRIVEAGEVYENIIASRRDLDAYVDLAILYWQATSSGFSTYYRLDEEFVAFASTRYQVLLHDAAIVHSGRVEPEFWRLYIGVIEYGDPEFIDRCKQFVASEPDCLVPYLHLHVTSESDRYLEKAIELAAECKAAPSVKNNYILSVLGSPAISFPVS